MRSALLAAFLAEAAHGRFDRRSSNCGLLLADWAVALGYADPAADLRGRLLRGRLSALIATRVARLGGEETAEPILGDIGLVLALTPRGVAPVGAICVGRRWVARGRTGLVGLSANPLAAWRL